MIISLNFGQLLSRGLVEVIVEKGQRLCIISAWRCARMSFMVP